MAVENNQQTVTIREVNKSLLSILGTFFGIGVTIATMYVMSNNTKMDSIIDVQNQTNLKIERYSITNELTNLNLNKVSDRVDVIEKNESLLDKDLSQVKIILQSHASQLKQQSSQIKALEK